MIRFTPFLLLLASGATTGCALAGESRLAIASESTVAIAGATALAADAHFPARMGLAAAREVLGSDAQQMDLVFVELTTIQARVDEHGRIRFAATAWTYGFEDRSSGAATVISVSRDGRTQRKGAASSSRHATIPDSWSIDMDDLSAIVAGLSPRAALALVHSARAWALIEGRDKVIPEDVRAGAPRRSRVGPGGSRPAQFDDHERRLKTRASTGQDSLRSAIPLDTWRRRTETGPA